MKRLYHKTLSIGICLIMSYSYLIAQLEGSFDATAAWNFHLETPGINLRSYFFLGEEACFGPEFTYFFENSKVIDEETITSSGIAIDINAHYVFKPLHQLGIYPILGFAYLQEREKIELHEEVETVIQKAWGINTGFGIETELSDRIGLFGEYIHTFSSLEDNVVHLGISYHWKLKSSRK